MSRDHAASPLASLESIMITGVIDAHEEQDVMMVDVPNAFIQAPMPEMKPGQDRGDDKDYRSASGHASSIES